MKSMKKTCNNQKNYNFPFLKQYRYISHDLKRKSLPTFALSLCRRCVINFPSHFCERRLKRNEIDIKVNKPPPAPHRARFYYTNPEIKMRDTNPSLTLCPKSTTVAASPVVASYVTSDIYLKIDAMCFPVSDARSIHRMMSPLSNHPPAPGITHCLFNTNSRIVITLSPRELAHSRHFAAMPAFFCWAR